MIDFRPFFLFLVFFSSFSNKIFTEIFFQKKIEERWKKFVKNFEKVNFKKKL